MNTLTGIQGDWPWDVDGLKKCPGCGHKTESFKDWTTSNWDCFLEDLDEDGQAELSEFVRKRGEEHEDGVWAFGNRATCAHCGWFIEVGECDPKDE